MLPDFFYRTIDKAGDYVVADLTNLNNGEYYPRIAIDLGMPRKWAAYNVGANKIADYGKLFAWGYPNPHNLYGSVLGQTSYPDNHNHIYFWTSGDSIFDAATAMWGEEWITPTEKEMFDLFYYSRMVDDSGNVMPLVGTDISSSATNDQWADPTSTYDTYIWQGTEGSFLRYNEVLLARFRSTFNDRYFYWPMSGAVSSAGVGKAPGTRGYFLTNSWWTGTGPFLFFLFYEGNKRLTYYSTERTHEKAYSVRAIKRYITK